eukprot:TRINITY_DN29679_c0_g1_i1.p1 TRINITY_DN29679_c0_g1~~TRINITY_DN29679_c0_g1_i1.p1  ORF type:complete len:407 (+),score=78.31 TRINITY_DN29679_c0_g1_i1:53-1273(+)
MSAVEIFFAVEITLFFFYFVVVFALYYKRRNLFPINTPAARERLILSVFVFVPHTLFDISYIFWRNVLRASVFTFLTYLLASTAGCGFLVMWFTFFQYRTAEDRNMNLTAKQSWFLRNNLMLLVYAINLTTALVVSWSEGSFQKSFDDILNGRVTRIPFAVTIFVYVFCPVAGIAKLAFHMGNKRDGFYIFSAILYMSISVVVTVSFWYFLDKFVSPSVALIPISIVSWELITGLVTTPVCLSYAFEKMKHIALDQRQSADAGACSTETNGIVMSRVCNRRGVSFTDVLQSPQLLEQFKGFLVTEFAVENILFYLEVNAFKEAVQNDPSMSRELGFELYKKFIADSSTHQINLAHPIYAELKRTFCPRSVEEMLAVDATVFDAACAQVLDLLERDSFMRFRLKFLT